MEVGQKGTITWSDGKTSRVILKDIESYSWLPTDYWLDYDESETHRPLVHPDFGVSKLIKSPILLPSALLFRVFKADEDESSYEYRLKKYIEDSFPEKNRWEAETAFRKLELTAGRKYIEDKYLS